MTVRIKRLLIFAYILTVPTLIFWMAVGVSVFLHNHRFVDILLFNGTITRVVFAALFPFLSLIIATISRVSLRQQAIAQNLWHRDTPAMKVNQGLINWSVILLGAMFISLINN